MQEPDKVAGYLREVTQRLKEDSFRVYYDVVYKDQAFRCVAKKTKWQFEYGGLIDTFFIFAEFFSLDMTSLREFSSTCLKYTRRSKIIPFLPYIGFNTVQCFPVALVDGIDAVTAEALRNEDNPRHFGTLEMPVICDLGSKQLHYSETRPLWGALYHERFAEIVSSMLTP